MRLAIVGVSLFLIATGPAEARKKHHAAASTDPAKPEKKKHLNWWPGPAAGPTMSGDPELVLTFDDGPNPKTTPRVLDILAKHHIHATFFLVGDRITTYPKEAPEIIARMLREGHIIGNHSMHHKDPCRVKTDEEAAQDIDDGKTTIEKVAGGFTTVWFRIPGGARCERIENLLAERHLSHFHWDLDPKEWKTKSAPKSVDYVEKHVGKMTGRNVLLMHDVKEATVEALPQILDWIDQENARRAAAHQRQIRIVPSYQIAIEKLPPGLADWIVDAAPDPTALANAIAAALP